MKRIQDFKLCPKTAEDKKAYNKEMFQVIAPKYDLVTKLLSWNRDVAWKRELITTIPMQDYQLCLDIACGTGDIAFGLASEFPDAQIHGIDLTPEMLMHAQGRNKYSNLQFLMNDMCHLAYQSESVDLITGGYALRNAPDLGIALREFARVLKPGGIAVFLDFSKSPSKIVQWINYNLLKFWGSLWGIVLHRNAAVYGYIAESLMLYPDRKRLHAMFVDSGFEVLTKKRYFCGIIERVICRRSA